MMINIVFDNIELVRDLIPNLITETTILPCSYSLKLQILAIVEMGCELS